MLCLKAEVLAADMFSSSSSSSSSAPSASPAPPNAAALILPVNIGSSILKAMHKGVGRRNGERPRRLEAASSADGTWPPPAAASASCSSVEEEKSNSSLSRRARRDGKMRHYRSELEEDVKKLQRKLQEEVELHVALAYAVAHNSAPVKTPSNMPCKAQELLVNIASLEVAISQLEKELDDLSYRLCHERNERLLAETHLEAIPSPGQSASTTTCTWEEHISSLRDMKFGGWETMQSVEEDMLPAFEQESLHALLEKQRTVDEVLDKEFAGGDEHGIIASSDQKIGTVKDILWKNPNQLSEEMVRCMRNIFLCLSESTKMSSARSLSDCSSSPAEKRSASTLTSFSDSSIIPSILRSPLDYCHSDSVVNQVRNSDPYNVNAKDTWQDIGIYSNSVEVSWMSVGKEQLEYAADALKRFRLLVEQLSRVNPDSLSCDEKLAFWINLYNALLMHAYLAYGVPRNDIKLFSLMQKACYTVGGQSFSAAEIEFVILKMKAPAHRPQLALMLALHKFKITEEHKRFAVDDTESLALFGLSCGMFSSPAVKIYSAANVRNELQDSKKEFIQASVGISEKGKLVVPKLLQSYAKGIVEDSLLADWICHHLNAEQFAFIRDSSSQRKQRLLGARAITFIPFDSRFRYLFLPDKKSSLSFRISEPATNCTR